MAGFSISPAERLRVLKVLESTKQNHLKSPEKLKYLLAPILVQGKAEQERFYELFDRYWEEVNQPWEMPEPEEFSNNKKFNWPKWLLVGMVLGFGIWAIFELLKEEKTPTVYFEFQPEVAIGDTLHLKNLSTDVDSAAMLWEIVNSQDSNSATTKSESFNFDFVPNSAGANPVWHVRLTYQKGTNPATHQPYNYTATFRVLCNNPPRIASIIAPKGAKANELVEFSSILGDGQNVQLSWDFGDTTILGARATHRFSENGQFEVRLTANRSGLEGYCATTKSHSITIGVDKPYLKEKILEHDHVNAVVNFSWGTWILMGILGLAIIWFWLKWAGREAPKMPGSQSADLAAAAEKFKSADKGPYFIPFRSQDGFVKMEPQFYRLADVLRQRQEGVRRNMDVAASVKKTIDEGGFPNLLSRADAVPTEYLFLIDEGTAGSHLSKLYTFLVAFLLKREVLGDVFYYNKEPISFWNQHNPEGLSPDQLHRLYPHHRLILMGDGHHLLDPNPPDDKTKPILRATSFAFFRQWKHRMMLTPMPVVSWTYREGALHNLFAIFPSDTEGLGEAVKFLERGMDGEELPVFSSWSEHLLEGRRESDLNYRNWRTAAEHKAYLKDHPLLYQWVCALAIYPKPEWEVTLTIGRALAPLGLELDYDNLLIISRIPWLTSCEMPNRLRKELWNDLDPEAEKLAREAVKSELEAIEGLVKESHVNQDHQINLALQSFALAPEAETTQHSIRQLLAMNLLTPKHLAELNQNVERHVRRQENPIQQQQSFMSKMGEEKAQIPDIQQFLEKERPKPEQPKRPIFTEDFWWATSASLAYLLIFFVAWNLEGTQKLTDWALPKENQNKGCDPQYLFAYMLKAVCTADSAIIFNNAGVDAYLELNDLSSNYRAKESSKSAIRSKAEFNFSSAIQHDPNYQLAQTNFGYYYFNWAASVFNQALASGARLDEELRLAFEHFRKASAFQSVKLDAQHGIGLVQYYSNQKDSALAVYNELLIESDSQYFDSTDIHPNLQTLLSAEIEGITNKVIIQVVDANSKRPLIGVNIISRNFSGKTDRKGQVEMEMRMGEKRTMDLSLRGFELTVKEIQPTAKNETFTVLMRQTKVNPERDSDGDGVPDIRDKCPKEPGDRNNAGCPLTIAPSNPIIKKEEQNIPKSEQTTPTEPDYDKDGVPDSQDKCPTVAGDINNGGCPSTIIDEPTPDIIQNPLKEVSPVIDEEVIDYRKAARKPLFKGCEEYSKGEDNCTETQLNDYVQQSLQYLQKVVKRHIEGTIAVNFFIEKDGSISNIKALNDLGEGIANEVEKVLKLIPKFKPALNELGEPIRVKYEQSFKFKIN